MCRFLLSQSVKFLLVFQAPPIMARMLSLDPDEIKRPENEDGGNFQTSSWRGNWKLIGLGKSPTSTTCTGVRC